MSSQADIEGVVAVPGATIAHFYSPADEQGVTDVLEEAKGRDAGLLIAGGRTRLHWANPARTISEGLSLRALSGVDEFEPDEGVLHARAGTRIEEIQSVANPEGWEVPLDTPGQTSTLGGTIATAAIGPRAQAFGRVADAVLGLEVVGADGARSKCGGRVVKNVTGYDMAKLYCGSFGSLAVVTGAWLRLRPLPQVRKALLLRVGSTPAEFESCRLLGQRAAVRALVWNQAADGVSPEVVVELAGSEEALAHESAAIARAMTAELISTERIDAFRERRAESPSGKTVIRAQVPGSACEGVMRTLLGAGFDVSVDPGLGVVHARGSLDRCDALLSIRRNVRQAGGFTTFENLPEGCREEIDVFDDQGDAASLSQALKARFDPSAILNPGRFAGMI